MKKVVLDPTTLYPPLPDSIQISTEREWVETFFQKNGLYWVKGNFLCDWTEEWLRVWDLSECLIEKKPLPRSKLEAWFSPLPIPDSWNDQDMLDWVFKLESSQSSNPIAHLLYEAAGETSHVWFEAPSVEHLAQWLSILIPEKYRPFERLWQYHISTRAAMSDLDLASYYLQEDKSALLRQWIGIENSTLSKLGKFPSNIPEFLKQEFEGLWEKQIIHSSAIVLDELTPETQAGMKQLATTAFRIFQEHPNWITKHRIMKIAPFLTMEQTTILHTLQPPLQPCSLSIDSTPQEMFTWVTEHYLPFRRWEKIHSPTDNIQSDKLATGFEEWIVANYPQLKIDSVDKSLLNYSVHTLVSKLCEHGPVFWVVVDGLGWLDHKDLLKTITEQTSLKIESEIEPRISVLPTKTEYAKWSLYSQLPPSHPSWTPRAGDGFKKVDLGKRYTDNQLGKLPEDLGKNNYKLFCWDTDELDQLYHSVRDWEKLYLIERPLLLNKIAKNIEFYLKYHPYPEQFKVIISSDHGQMLGGVSPLTDFSNELDPKGRMAVGATTDQRFIVLEAGRFDLPHDISVVRGAACLHSFNANIEGKVFGTHGGLFPEEVIVGVSVLCYMANRFPVIVECRGEGEAGQLGDLVVIVDNPNSVPLTNLCLYINEIPCLKFGSSIEDNKILPKQKTTFKIKLPKWPELPLTHKGQILKLSGSLSFQFADADSGIASLAPESAIMVRQLFQSGMDIDDLL